MKLKNSLDYYSTDQGIKLGDRVIVWNSYDLSQDSMVLKVYNSYDVDRKEHIASNMAWKNAVKVTEPIELDPRETEPTPEEPKIAYADIWVKAYSASPANNEKVADDALAAFKVREKNGDFNKLASADAAVIP